MANSRKKKVEGERNILSERLTEQIGLLLQNPYINNEKYCLHQR